MAQKPIPRYEIPLANGWHFAIDPGECGQDLGWQAPDFNDGRWEKVTIPHSWNTRDAYASYEGIAWYRLSFDTPTRADEAMVCLRFEAVFYLTRVWLNGMYLGEHEGGYTPFEFDISSMVRRGGKNVLAVRVDNERKVDRLPAHLYEGRSYGWNNYGGIVREVKLIVTSQVYLDILQVGATPHIIGIDQADWAAVSIQAHIYNHSPEGFLGQVILTVAEEKNTHLLVSIAEPINVSSGSKTIVTMDTSFQDPKLWHFDHPNLYSCAISMQDMSGNEYDRRITTIGIREINWNDGRFLLNGEPVRLVGLSRHANVPGFGLAETIPVMARDFDDLKSLNMVFGRPIHYPQHEFIYDYCDRKGILLIPELPAWQLTAGQMADEPMRALAKRQLAEMIAAARNHPCVWAWSVGNELESDTVAGRAFVGEMVEYVKSLDPTRPVGFASYHLLVGRPWSDATRHSDFVMMNEYFGTWHGPKDSLGVALDTIHLTWPEKMVVISEFGFSPHWQHIEGPAIINAKQYYHIPGDAPADSPEADVQRQKLIKDQMRVFRCRPFVSAAVFWDYRGNMGVMDNYGKQRPSWEILREEFSPILIEQATFSFPQENTCRMEIRLHVRGPVALEMPAYTLRNYRIAWQFVLPDGKPLELRGDADLPVLTPGTNHDLKVEIPTPPQKSQVHISVLRPTGFIVIDRYFLIP